MIDGLGEGEGRRAFLSLTMCSQCGCALRAPSSPASVYFQRTIQEILCPTRVFPLYQNSLIRLEMYMEAGKPRENTTLPPPPSARQEMEVKPQLRR